MLMLRREFLIMSISESVYDANHDDDGGLAELKLTRIKLFLTQDFTQTLAIRLSDHEMCNFTNHGKGSYKAFVRLNV